MAASHQVWPDAFNTASFANIEEGPLNETENTLQIQDSSLRPHLHNWEDFVSDHSVGQNEVAYSDDGSKSNAGVELGNKDWEQYLSAFSLNDDDCNDFKPLKVHKDSDDDIESTETQTFVPSISETGKSNFTTATTEIHHHNTSSFPQVLSTNVYRDIHEGDMHEKKMTRPGSAPTLHENIANVNSDTSTLRPHSVPLWNDVVNQKPFVHINSSNQQLSALWSKEKFHLVSSVDNLKPRLLPSQYLEMNTVRTLPVQPFLPGEHRSLVGESVSENNDVQPCSTNSIQPVIMVPKNGSSQYSSLKELSHSSGDGRNEVDIQDYSLLQSFPVTVTAKHCSHPAIPAHHKDSLSLPTSSSSHIIQSDVAFNANVDSINRDDAGNIHTENAITSRETVENLPERPLTIGNSLNMGSTFAYRPTSLFQANFNDNVGNVVSTIAATSTVTTTHHSLSLQHSEGTTEDEAGDDEAEDISNRERLQPLGRDGMEVKQGPPWGITMPLFQPGSRNSSLSSNDSNTSSNTFWLPQPHPSKDDTQEKTDNVSSAISVTDLSPKSSLKSLEPKEPIAAMDGGGGIETPVDMFHHQYHRFTGDSPVSRILGSTFKATQTMLMELQRRPLGTYKDEEYHGETAHKEHTSTSLSQEIAAVTHESKKGDLRVNMEEMDNEIIPEARLSQNSSHSNDGRQLQHEATGINETIISSGTVDRLHEVTSASNTPTVVTANSQDLDAVIISLDEEREDDVTSKSLMKDDASKCDTTPVTTTTDHLIERLSNDTLQRSGNTVYSTVKEAENHHKEMSRSITTQVITYVTPPTVSSSHMLHDQSRQISGVTDSTLENSFRLSQHMNGERTGVVQQRFESKNIVENGANTSDMSEFDRVASESLSWSNAVVKQFHEEMRYVHREIQESFIHSEDEKPATDLTPKHDSGVSESSTNDEIYRPRRLTRLSTVNYPIGIYDVRQSSGPGSTNRKRLALGKKPRGTSRSVDSGHVYVSDGTTVTSDTDNTELRKMKKNTGSGLERGVIYVSESVKGSGGGHVQLNSTPDGQSTPKSEDITQDDIPSSRKHRNEKNKVDMYLGFANFQFDKPPEKITRSVVKPKKTFSSAFLDYRSEKSAHAPLSFAPLNHVITSPSRLYRNSNEMSGNKDDSKSGNILIHPTAKVTQTWSISKPVMSQLVRKPTVKDSDIVESGVFTKQQQHHVPLKQTTAEPLRSKRSKRNKDGGSVKFSNVTVPQSTSQKRNIVATQSKGRKKSVADMILENVIEEEREQKRRQNKLETKQIQANRDLNELWERFQLVFGKTSSSNVTRNTTQRMSQQPLRTRTDSSLSSSSNPVSSERSNSMQLTTDSDVDFERFMLRVQEFQTSDSSIADDLSCVTSRASSSQELVASAHDSDSTPVLRPSRDHRRRTTDSSTSITSSEDRHVMDYYRKQRDNLSDNPIVVTRSVTLGKRDIPISIPTRFRAKDKIKYGEGSPTCTCGIKTGKDPPKQIKNPPGTRDVGVNCPTPPVGDILGSRPVYGDIALLKAEPVLDANVITSASLVKLSLQDALMYRKHEFIERSQERVMKLKAKQEERKRDKMSKKAEGVSIFIPNERKIERKRSTLSRKENKSSATDKLNEQLQQLQRKSPRIMTSKDIRDVNKRAYRNLPEVRKKKDDERRAAFYQTNRLRAKLYGKHVRNANRMYTAA